jgi:hypothetical protein
MIKCSGATDYTFARRSYPYKDMSRELTRNKINMSLKMNSLFRLSLWILGRGGWLKKLHTMSFYMTLEIQGFHQRGFDDYSFSHHYSLLSFFFTIFVPYLLLLRIKQLLN